MIPGALSFFVIFVAAIVGGAVGQLVHRVMGRRNNMWVGMLTALGFVIGAFIVPFRASMAVAASGGGTQEMVEAMFGNPWAFVFAVIAGGVAWSQIK
jgi:hypothetical protein